ncbi:hypothetical protein HU200_059305 [Digitaria exilis]|uniref:Uncharacterized protein n=1 Tax=Digitaria exilis TaxID=1010633 RepID=A0A835AIS1_9POAL|nr:hypothetical protein HU200_059305 [Digitaria exilis]
MVPIGSPAQDPARPSFPPSHTVPGGTYHYQFTTALCISVVQSAGDVEFFQYQQSSYMALLLLSSCQAAWSAAADNAGARRLLVSRPSTSRQKAEQAQQQQQQMRVDGRKTPFKQPTASFGRRIPRSGWNPIQNR